VVTIVVVVELFLESFSTCTNWGIGKSSYGNLLGVMEWILLLSLRPFIQIFGILPTNPTFHGHIHEARGSFSGPKKVKGVSRTFLNFEN
jgi:hypothetical protein